MKQKLKSLIQRLRIVQFWKIGVLSLCLMAGVTACKTPQVMAYKVEGVVITTVDSAMKAWADWANSGKATTAQIVAVHKAYDTYYNAQQVAKLALEAYVASTAEDKAAAWQTASANVASASTAVIELVKGLLK